MKRKICVVTDSRAEYGLLFWLMKELHADIDIELQTVVAGSHLSREFGLTFREIERDGFKIDGKVEMTLSSDTGSGISKSVGLGCILFSDVFERLAPDIVVLLGDRYEMMAAAIAAHVMRIPIAHLHGGETTEGAIDEAFRHSISKMASLHFTTTDNHRRRVAQLGESPDRIYNFGAPGTDHLHRTKLMSREELQQSLDFNLSGNVAIVTYHPVTLEKNSSETQVMALLEAIKATPALKAVFTKANADTDGRIINECIANFCAQDPARFKFVDSLGQTRYMSALKNFSLMIGNSSSGVIESASFGIPVVNIGDRQKGRDRGANVIDIGYSKEEIQRAILKAITPEFQKAAKETDMPYAGKNDGNISREIAKTLKETSLDHSLLRKPFHDIL